MQVVVAGLAAPGFEARIVHVALGEAQALAEQGCIAGVAPVAVVAGVEGQPDPADGLAADPQAVESIGADQAVAMAVADHLHGARPGQAVEVRWLPKDLAERLDQVAGPLRRARAQVGAAVVACEAQRFGQREQRSGAGQGEQDEGGAEHGVLGATGPVRIGQVATAQDVGLRTECVRRGQRFQRTWIAQEKLSAGSASFSQGRR